MSNPFAGTWTYRSFLNDPTLTNGDPQKLAALLFAEGTWTVKDAPPTVFDGELSFGVGFVMDLKGDITPAIAGRPAHTHIVGSGRDGTPSAGYFYDYDGSLTEHWTNGVNQVAAITGSVIRVKPHSGEAAGLVASFIAVQANEHSAGVNE
jgi:hypothetical protein